jgi:thiosulfate/3-mercaptopyruvate sulfurtransferase
MTTPALVSPDWLAPHLHDPTVRVVESSTTRAVYDEAHIPGAVYVDAHAELLRNGDDTSGEVLTPRQFASLMGRLGVAPQTTVVWYGDRHSSYAIRGFWTMAYYRHPGPFAVLDGGRERWAAAGHPMTADATHVARTTYPEPQAVDDSGRANWRDVVAAMHAKDAVILDVRDRDEYDGRNVRAARGGHIPGAVHIEWTDATAGDSVLRPLDELRRMYEARGVTPDKEVIAHCQLGIRASHTWFVLKHVLGYPHVRNYDGSWQEWGNNHDLPVER